MSSRLPQFELAHSVVGAFYEVYNYFGYGLAESVYANALRYELNARGHQTASEVSVPVEYKGRRIAWSWRSRRRKFFPPMPSASS